VSGIKERYWEIDLREGDLIHVETDRIHAVLEVKTVIGNQIVYDVIVTDESYYGTDMDDRMIHKQNLLSNNFRIEKEE